MTKRIPMEDILTEENLERIKGWCRDGLNETDIATNMGISYTTFQRWKKKSSELVEVLKNSRELADIKVENALFKRACGYDWDEVTSETDNRGNVKTKVVTRHQPADIAACIFWLKNRLKGKWVDRPQSESEQVMLEEARKILEGLNSAF